jgi:hypothetical protein
MQIFERDAVDETSAVHVSGQHHIVVNAAGRCVSNHAHACVRTNKRWDLVKRDVTSRDQISVQLESLILAQSERWRQA